MTLKSGTNWFIGVGILGDTTHMNDLEEGCAPIGLHPSGRPHPSGLDLKVVTYT